MKMRKDAGEIQEGKKKKAEASLCERDILFGHDQPLQPASVWTRPAFVAGFCLDTAGFSAALFGHSQLLSRLFWDTVSS